MKRVVFFLWISLTVFQCASQKQTAMDSWSYPYPIQYLELADDLRVAYVEEGKGETTLLFIHGLGSNLKAWQKNIATLSDDYRCIALDLPGYGKSSKGDYSFSMQFFAETINAFVQKKRLKNVVLVGHSMGGQIAVHALLQNPTIAQQLVLVASAGFEQFTEQERNWFASVYTPAVVKMTSEEQIVKNFELNFVELPEDARFMIDDRLEMKASEAYDYYCNMIPQCVNAMLTEPIFDRLSTITLPTLVLYGEQDALIPNTFLHPTLDIAQVAKAGSGQLADSKLILVPAAGHFVNWEQAAAVNEAIYTFLDEQ
ncbi:MAG: alpha/beta hydrolase [Bacteroidota bacterium]